jgi:pSer/pThr/pTyr-binding forkhead associated (FHA) protein
MSGTKVVIPERESALLTRKGRHLSEKAVYELKPRATCIGRNPQNDIVLNDPCVSSYHAKIRMEDGSYFIYDFATTNGTWVNGRKIYRKRIVEGDIVTIGQSSFAFITPETPLSLRFGE